MHFQQHTNILDVFLYCIVSDLVFIYFRDSTYNLRLWHLILGYINENLKLIFISTMDCYNIEQGHMKVLALLLIETDSNLTKQ